MASLGASASQLPFSMYPKVATLYEAAARCFATPLTDLDVKWIRATLEEMGGLHIEEHPTAREMNAGFAHVPDAVRPEFCEGCGALNSIIDGECRECHTPSSPSIPRDVNKPPVEPANHMTTDVMQDRSVATRISTAQYSWLLESAVKKVVHEVLGGDSGLHPYAAAIIEKMRLL